MYMYIYAYLFIYIFISLHMNIYFKISIRCELCIGTQGFFSSSTIIESHVIVCEYTKNS